MNQKHSLAIAIMAMFASFLATGCAKSQTLQRLAVSGTVTANGDPLPTGTITFLPAEGTSGPAVGGTIEQGKFKLTAANGPAAGTHRVEIRASRPTGKKIKSVSETDGSVQEVDDIAPYIPALYNTNSTLTLEITPESAHNITLNLTIP